MSFGKRLDALEDKFIREPITVLLADGSIHQMCGGTDYQMALLAAAREKRKDLSPGQSRDLEAIARMVKYANPNGDRLLEITKCFLDGSVKTVNALTDDFR